MLILKQSESKPHKMIRIAHTIIIICFPIVVAAQEAVDNFNRLEVIRQQSMTFYNTEGIDFASKTTNYAFNDKNLKILYRKFQIKNEDIKKSDDKLLFKNVVIEQNSRIDDSLQITTANYFIEDRDGTVTYLYFVHNNSHDIQFDRKYISAILNNEIPENLFKTEKMDSLKFIGRSIKLPNSYYWRGASVLQCPYNGEMNWSIHRNLQSAEKSIRNQYLSIASRNSVKMIKEENVNIIFEGTPTIAKRIVYDIKGVNSLAVGLSGAKTLTVYFVAAKVREVFASCCLSFWNNDNISSTGLTPFFDQILTIATP